MAKLHIEDLSDRVMQFRRDVVACIKHGKSVIAMASDISKVNVEMDAWLKSHGIECEFGVKDE
jgi:hypothetical protein